jgi:hypothetical protein
MALDINNALEQSLTTEIGDILKGKRKSLKDAMKAIAKSAIDSLIDNLAKNLVEDLDLFGTGPGRRMTDAMVAGGVEAGATIAAQMTAAGNTIATMLGGGAIVGGSILGDPTSDNEGKLAKFFESMKDSLTQIFRPVATGVGAIPAGASQISSGLIAGSDPEIDEIIVTGAKIQFDHTDPVFSNITDGIKGIGQIMKENTSIFTKVKDIAFEILRFLPSLLKDLGNLFLKGLSQFSPGAATGIGNFFGAITSFIPGFGSGGIHSMGRRMGYSTGGIARGARSGYPAMLHGTEAIVPLPNGKSIPVHMQGGAGNISNITVNVASDGSTNVSGTTAGDSQQQMDIGRAIAQAVKEELHRQRRSGGILSRYGAAGGI